MVTLRRSWTGAPPALHPPARLRSPRRFSRRLPRPSSLQREQHPVDDIAQPLTTVGSLDRRSDDTLDLSGSKVRPERHAQHGGCERLGDR